MADRLIYITWVLAICIPYLYFEWYTYHYDHATAITSAPTNKWGCPASWSFTRESPWCLLTRTLPLECTSIGSRSIWKWRKKWVNWKYSHQGSRSHGTMESEMNWWNRIFNWYIWTISWIFIWIYLSFATIWWSWKWQRVECRHEIPTGEKHRHPQMDGFSLRSRRVYPPYITSYTWGTQGIVQCIFYQAGLRNETGTSFTF